MLLLVHGALSPIWMSFTSSRMWWNSPLIQSNSDIKCHGPYFIYFHMQAN
jgi:hypothetical protein